MHFRQILFAGAVALCVSTGPPFAADNVPYVVRGNTHMLIGVTYDDVPVWSGGVEAGECDAGTGSINYPSKPTWTRMLGVTQYAFAGKFCGAKMTSIEFRVSGDHPLARLNPQPAG